MTVAKDKTKSVTRVNNHQASFLKRFRHLIMGSRQRSSKDASTAGSQRRHREMGGGVDGGRRRRRRSKTIVDQDRSPRNERTQGRRRSPSRDLPVSETGWANDVRAILAGWTRCIRGMSVKERSIEEAEEEEEEMCRKEKSRRRERERRVRTRGESKSASHRGIASPCYYS